MNCISRLFSLTLLSCSLLACSSPKIELLSEDGFCTEIDGKAVALYSLKALGKGNIVAQITNFGCRVVSLWTPDRDGVYEDVVLGHDSIDKYLHYTGERYLGPIVGPVANRVAAGRFELDGKEYTLPQNNNGQTLHGGLKGVDMLVWDVVSQSDSSIRMSLVRPEGLDGFPGPISMKVEYVLTSNNELKISYWASSEQKTPINLTNHSIFNLKGCGKGTIEDHEIQIFASAITPVDSVLIPSGEMLDVEGTPFDFREPHTIGERIEDGHQQLIFGAGYDHNWVLDSRGESLSVAAVLYEPSSGRQMEVITDQPGLQFYSGNFFDGSAVGKYGRSLNYREGIALETQNFPDAVNQPSFPNSIVNPGEIYTHTCIYRFSVRK